MLDPRKFESVFPQNAAIPYKREFVQEAEAFRRSFGGLLFIDRVLTAFGLEKGMLLTPLYLHALL